MENTRICNKDDLFCLEKDDAAGKKAATGSEGVLETVKKDDHDITITTVDNEKEPKPALRLVLKKRKRESVLVPKAIDVDFRVFKFHSVEGASDDHDHLKKHAMVECLRKICGRRNDYQRLEAICRGAFGAVYRARERRTKSIVAMKGLFDDTATASTLREIDLLMSMRHPNVVDFKEAVADDAGKIYLIMEYAEMDLHRHIYSAAGQEFLMRGGRVKILMRQLLEGVKFLHDNKVMHRDLKPSNLLVNNEGVLKICDFGMSRRMDADAAGAKYSSLVGTGRYRAPELMEGVEAYTEAVDMWSVGCILAEMLLRMNGDADAGESLNKIFWIVASDEKTILRDYIPVSVVTDSGFDLLKRLLSYIPGLRITAEDALNHDWFKESGSWAGTC